MEHTCPSADGEATGAGITVKSLASGQETERRRKRLAGAVGAAAGAVLLSVAWSYWRSPRQQEQLLPAKILPGHAGQQLSGYSFTRSVGGRRIFTVHAAKTVAFERGGAMMFEDVWVEFFGSGAKRHDILRTDQCKFNPQTGALTAEGKVDIVLNADSVSSRGTNNLRDKGQTEHPPVFIETSNLSFEQQGSLLVSEGPVEFGVGRAKGRARGLRYAIEQGWLELGSEVSADFPLASGPRSGPMAHLSASRLRYNKSKSEITLGGPVVITQGHQRLNVAEAAIRLDSGNRVVAATLNGVEGRDNSIGGEYQFSAPTVQAEFGPDHRLRQLTGVGGVEVRAWRRGQTIHMASQTLEVEFSGNPPRPLKGSAGGGVRVTSVTRPGASSRVPSESDPPRRAVNRGLADLTADRLDFSFQPGGPLLSESRTAGPGTLVFHPDSPQQGERDVTSTPLIMTFDSRGQLAGLEGLSHSQIVFLPSMTAAKGTPAEETTSDRFNAEFEPATESLKYLDELGNVRFREGDRRASAGRAHYVAATNAVELRALTPGKGNGPVLWDPETRIAADQIVVDFDDGTFEGRGHIETTHAGGLENSTLAGADDPTHVVADRVTAKRRDGSLHYEGHVRAWHGANVLESTELDISKAKRQISSPARVMTSHSAERALAPGLKAKAGKEVRPVVISADRFEYFEEGRKGSYRGNVVLESAGTTLTADALDVFFAPASTGDVSEIERAVGSGHVVVVHETRRGMGDRAEYWAKDGKIELSGGPPVLYDAGRDYLTGRRLTFFLADDTVLVDGDARSPTFSKHRIPQ